MKTKEILDLLNKVEFSNEHKAEFIAIKHENEIKSQRVWRRRWLFIIISPMAVLLVVQAGRIRSLQSDVDFYQSAMETCLPTNWSKVISETQDSTIAHDCRLIMHCSQVPLDVRKNFVNVLKNQIK